MTLVSASVSTLDGGGVHIVLPLNRRHCFFSLFSLFRVAGRDERGHVIRW